MPPPRETPAAIGAGGAQRPAPSSFGLPLLPAPRSNVVFVRPTCRRRCRKRSRGAKRWHPRRCERRRSAAFRRCGFSDRRHRRALGGTARGPGRFGRPSGVSTSGNRKSTSPSRSLTRPSAFSAAGLRPRHGGSEMTPLRNRHARGGASTSTEHTELPEVRWPCVHRQVPQVVGPNDPQVLLATKFAPGLPGFGPELVSRRAGSAPTGHGTGLVA
jgi:hypothetical protein